MTIIALAFSVFVAGLGALGLVSPSRLLGLDRYFQTRARFYFAAAIRLFMGVSLFFAAPESRAPDALRILGVVITVAGVITLFLGLERFRWLVDWWLAHGSTFVRAWAAIALAFGLLLAWALVC